MSHDVYVDLAYQGIELGTRVCMQEFTESEAYVQCPTPMPVGSEIVVMADEGIEIAVRVARVSEQVAGTERPAGMLVGAANLQGQARDWWMARVGDAPAPSAQPTTETEAAPEAVDVANAEPSPTPEPEAEVQAAAEPDNEPEAPAEEAKPAKKKRRRRKKH